MTTRTLTLNEVRDLAQRKRPWTLRLECSRTGMYWYATGRGLHEPVEIVQPPTGTGGCLADFAHFARGVGDRLGEGFVYAGTPYIPLSKRSWDLVKAGWSSPNMQVTTLVPTKDGFDGLDKDGNMVRAYTMDEGRDLILGGQMPMLWHL